MRREGVAEKLSFSGAVIRSSDPPPLGTIIELRLVLEGRELRLFAEVKWLDPDPGGGGRFGVLYLLPTTGRMLDLLDVRLKTG